MDSSILEPLVRLFVEGNLIGAMAAGVLLGLVFGAVPGLSGRLGIVLLFPVLLDMPPEAGVVLLIAMHSVVHTGGSIPGILFGVPGGAADAATVVDGLPMTKRGLAGEALGASLSASAVGGVIGAVFLAAFLPFAREIALLLSPPEFLLIAAIGLSASIALSGRDFWKGFAATGLGLLLGTIGGDPMDGVPRFTFGLLELWNGIDPVILFAGVFAIPELLGMASRGGRISEVPPGVIDCSFGSVLRGMAAVCSRWWLTVRTSLIGVVVGFVPGLGADAASWISYGHAAQTVRSRIPFGEGAIEGVIAPETANNAKEGGSLAPTLAFGIPGSASMALVIAALSILGIPVGPELVTHRVEIVWLIIWTLAIANIVAVGIFLAGVPLMGRIAYLKSRYIVAASLVLSVGTLGAGGLDAVRLVLLLLAVVLGVVMMRGGWPRAPLLLGYVLGPTMEKALHQTTMIWGWSFVERPASLILLAALAGMLVWGARRTGSAGGHEGDGGRRPSDRVVAGALALAGLAAVWAAAGFPSPARWLPLAAALLLTGCLLPVLLRRPPPRGMQGAGPPQQAMRPLVVPLLWFAGLAFGIWLAGLTIASLLFMVLFLALWLGATWRDAVACAAGVAAAQWLMFVWWMRLPIDLGAAGRLF